MDVWETMWARLAVELTGCDTARRSKQLAEACALAGVSLDTAYRRLKAHGWTSGRTRRTDAGKSKVSQAELEEVAAHMARSRGRRARATMPTSVAADVTGLSEKVSVSHTRRLLRQHGLGVAALHAPKATISRVSTHPNHVWQVDVSVALKWHFREPETGRRLTAYDDPDRLFYKPEQWKAVRRVIHRYLVVDHATGSLFVRYYYQPGERAEDVVDFLWHACAPKVCGGSFPFRGIPRRMVLDQGSAFRAALTRELLTGLGVEHIEYHLPGQPQASGSVEKTHELWQARFESRLQAEPVEDLAELNELALRYAAHINATAQHGRTQKTRRDAWLTIQPEQLREAPSRDIFFGLATAAPKTGTLDNRLWLSVDGQKYLCRGGVAMPGAKVSYRLAPFTDAGLRAWDQNGLELGVTRLCFDELGFATNGLRHVWDDAVAKGATAPSPPAHTVRDQLASGAREMAPVVAFKGLDDVTEALPVTGKPWAPAEAATISAEARMSSLDCREEVARRLGGSLGRDGAWWKATIGDGLTRVELEAAWLSFLDLNTVQAKEA